MSFWSSLGGIFDESGRAKADNASNTLAQALTPQSPYYAAGQLTGDQDVINGAAQLAANKVGYDPSAMDADTAAIGSLGNTFGDIQANGGQLTQAVLNQARSDLANTNVHALDHASRQQAATVLAQDSAERNWAASNKNQSRAQQLAAQLQKQVWNTAVSHANFQSALAAQSLKNEDRNAAFDLANQISTGGQQAGNAQTTLNRAMQAQDFNNAIAGLRAIGGGLGAATSTLTDMASASPSGSASTFNYTPSTAPAQTYDNNYAVPNTRVSTASKYVNPITGNTVNLNMPTDSSAWGDWLTSGSTLASV